MGSRMTNDLMTAELLIIQDRNSWLTGCGVLFVLNFGPEVRLHPLRRRVIQTLADEYLAVADFNQHDSLFRQPSVPSAQSSPGIHRRCIVRNFRIGSKPLPFLLAPR